MSWTQDSSSWAARPSVRCRSSTTSWPGSGSASCWHGICPHDDARLRLAPAVVIGLVVRNLIVSHQPVYALGEWAAPYRPGLLGVTGGDAAALNDDRVGGRWIVCSTPTGRL